MSGTFPAARSKEPLDDLFTQGLKSKLTAALAEALQHVRALEATVGVTVADIEAKQAAKTRLDRAIAPFKILAAAWSGGVMLGTETCDDSAYAALAKRVADVEWRMANGETLRCMVAKGLGVDADAPWDQMMALADDGHQPLAAPHPRALVRLGISGSLLPRWRRRQTRRIRRRLGQSTMGRHRHFEQGLQIASVCSR